MYRLLIFTLFTIICVYSKPTEAKIFVSPYMSFYIPDIITVISPGEYHVEPLYALKEDVEFKIEGYVSGIFTDIVPLICDEENLQKYSQKESYSCWGGEKKYGQFQLREKTYSDTAHYLVIYNPLDLLKPFNTKTVHAQTQISYTFSSQERENIENILNSFYQGFLGLFEIEEFDVKFGPCNARNAYSDFLDGDITICSEILGESHLQEKGGIFGGVLLHELGHTVLNLWGLPGWDNEKTADEFATVMLIISGKGRTGKAKEWIGFFNGSRKIIASQAENIAEAGSPHPLDIQRIAAIQGIIDDPLPVVKRWNNILYPHMRAEILRQIFSGEFDIYGRDVALAEKILTSRED